jgi:rubrerythrin
MTHQDLNLADTIRIAMEAEQKAAALYGDAAQKTSNPLGQRLFNRLAEFERHHYDKLLALQESLREQGAFTEYEGEELSLPAPGEVEGIPEPHKMSMMKIVTMAQEVERKAEERYVALAGQTTDPTGQAMFKRLAEEEQAHFRLLRDVYWNLNDHGTWSWSA